MAVETGAGPRENSSVRIPNVNTLADLIDRLIVEVNKLSWFENRKREEHAKDNSNPSIIAKWDNLSRDCCELRSILKNEINKCLSEIVELGEYSTIKEPRTFRPPAGKIEDILADMCLESARSIHNGKLKLALSELFEEEK